VAAVSTVQFFGSFCFSFLHFAHSCSYKKLILCELKSDLGTTETLAYEMQVVFLNLTLSLLKREGY